MQLSADYSSGYDGRPPSRSFPPLSVSVEAFASVLVPVAVDDEADHDEQETAQHGEEDGEEHSNTTPPFFILTH